MRLCDTVIEWFRHYGRGEERAAAKDDLARMLEEMVAELDAAGQPPLLLIRARFPRHSLVAGALRTLLSWRQRPRFARLWRRYRSLWQQAEGLGIAAQIAQAPDSFVAQLRDSVQALLAFLRA